MFSLTKQRLARSTAFKRETVVEGTRAAGPSFPATGPPSNRAYDRTLRLVCAGALTPHTVAADLLDCAIVWAEEHTDQSLSLAWLGVGDLRNLLAAQPLPPTLSQSFPGALSEPLLAAYLADADLLCIADRAPAAAPIIAAVRAAGVAFLGPRRSSGAAGLLAEGQSGWLFDEGRPASLTAALRLGLDGCRTRLTGDSHAATAGLKGQAG